MRQTAVDISLHLHSQFAASMHKTMTDHRFDHKERAFSVSVPSHHAMLSRQWAKQRAVLYTGTITLIFGEPFFSSFPYPSFHPKDFAASKIQSIRFPSSKNYRTDLENRTIFLFQFRYALPSINLNARLRTPCF